MSRAGPAFVRVLRSSKATTSTSMLAVAHGSPDPRHTATIDNLLSRVRFLRPQLRVEAAYLDHGGPTTTEALHDLARDGQRDIVVVPLLLTAAHHARIDVPGAVEHAFRSLPAPWQKAVGRLRVADPLGPHRLLIAGLERRLNEAAVLPSQPGTSVVLGWAGSADQQATTSVRTVARAWQRNGWHAVVPASASNDETQAVVQRLLTRGAQRVVAAPYFLAPGLLADRFRAAALRAGAQVCAAELGDATEVAQTVLTRFDAA